MQAIIVYHYTPAARRKCARCAYNQVFEHTAGYQSYYYDLKQLGSFNTTLIYRRGRVFTWLLL